MFRIRHIYDDTRPLDKSAISQVLDIIRSHFASLSEEKINDVIEQLRNPLKYKFRTTLFVAENKSGNVLGVAIMMYAPDLNFCYLDYIASRKDIIASGIGGSLYERVKEEASNLKVSGLFFESLPDDPDLCKNPALLEQNKARLKFYERYGAYPLINTKYEMPVNPKDDCPPYLVCDFLGNQYSIPKKVARKIIKAILNRKYPDYCPEEYVKAVVNSVKDDPVILRKPLYIKKQKINKPGKYTRKEKIILIQNDNHSIHHIQDKGYVESPVRIKSIQKELLGTDIFREIQPLKFSEKNILQVHDHGYISYFKRVCNTLPPGKSVYPYIFPIRNIARPPEDDTVRAGYYCIDTFTPLNKNAYLAARMAVDCTLTGAEMILQGYSPVYSLVRPPGHHAERRAFGGFCYFNSNAIAANYLSKFGKVAILDIDYHHGNGQQDIFYKRKDVLTISIHGNPSFAYPYFSGFKEEKGEEEGIGFNVNYPLKEQLTGEEYRETLKIALKRIARFKPEYLIVALGLDVAKGDPTGTWSLSVKDFYENGRMIGSLHLPTLVVQEGGYKNRILGTNAKSFFTGLYSTHSN